MKFLAFFLLLSYCRIAQKVTRGPYLQKPGKHTMTLQWRTEQPVVGEVTFKEAGSSEAHVRLEGAPAQDHVIELSALRPGHSTPTQ